jgi:hypothetical protein
MIILGIEPVAWQDTQYVLRQFGPTENEARRCYLEYVAKMAGLDSSFRWNDGWFGCSSFRRRPESRRFASDY